MSDSAVLIFTFSPVQSFIIEARRTSDLFVGSQILVELARAAAKVFNGREGRNQLIYPASLEADIPNRIVAVVPWSEVKATVDAAQKAMQEQWKKFSQQAQLRLKASGMPDLDTEWYTIWNRQFHNVWEYYWIAERLVENDYKRAYEDADRRLDGLKKTRYFVASEEAGLKDTLSGRRSALRIQSSPADRYWADVAGQVTAAKLRPDGRERLDALGAIKRFCNIATTSFASTSTIATQLYLQTAVNVALPLVKSYAKTLEELGIDEKYQPRRNRDNKYAHEAHFSFDGDMLYEEILTSERLQSEYQLKEIDPEKLINARTTLRAIYRNENIGKPTPYYAILLLDGDNMGKQIRSRLDIEADPLHPIGLGHREFSNNLSEFAQQVTTWVRTEQPDHSDQVLALGEVVYSGGDDVLALLPLATAYPVAKQMARQFHRITGGTASAGLVVVHHTYPLYAALQAVRKAEASAKQAFGQSKSALCIHVLKRSGEPLKVHSQWQGMEHEGLDLLITLIQHFESGALSSKLAYDISQATYALPVIDARFKSELKRLAYRHRHPDRRKLSDNESNRLIDSLFSWGETMPKQHKEPAVELANWILLARFLATGGKE